MASWRPAIVHGLATLMVLIIAFPYSVGLFYFEHGSRALGSVMAEGGGEQLEAQAIPITGASNLAHLDKAISYLESATRWSPYYARVYSELARAYLLSGNYAGARDALQSLSPFPARSSPEFAERMTLYAQLRDLSAEDEQVKKAWASFGVETMDFIQAGRYYEEQEKNDLALPLYKAAFLLDRSWSDVWYAQGRVLEWSLQRDEALQAYLQAFELANYQRVRPSDVLLRIGMAYRKKDPQDLENALRSLDAALAVDDFETKRTRAQAHYQRAEVLHALGRDPSEYIQAYQESIKAYGPFFRSHLQLGIVYFEELQDLGKAEKEFRTTLDLKPDANMAYFYLGEVYAARGERAKAITMYQKALALYPDNAEAEKRLKALRGSDQE